VLFLRAIGTNTMVCVAISMFNACIDSADKLIAVWMPIVTFVVCGFEHCVENSESLWSVPARLHDSNGLVVNWTTIV
jgi:formate/nitrite transporter FocA (FNT family)